MLEYLANCGHTIDRNLIIALFNNEAIAYQKFNMIDKASDYLEAIIFNLEQYLDNPEQIATLKILSHFDQAKSSHQSLDEKQQLCSSRVNTILKHQFQLASFLLKFSGIFSMKNEGQALLIAKKALKTLRQHFQYCYYYVNSLPNMKKVSQLYQIFKKMPLQFEVNDYYENWKELVSLVGETSQWYYSLSDAEKQQIEIDLKDTSLQDFFWLQLKTFSEAQLDSQPSSPLTESNQTFLFSLGSNIKKIMCMTATYFAISVQLQEEINRKKIRNNNQIYSKCMQKSFQDEKETLKQISELYHIQSLTLAYRYTPFPNKMKEYLVQSFKETYDKQIIAEMSIVQPLSSQIDQLKDKYKAYLIDKDIDIESEIQRLEEESVSSEEIKSDWDELKKSSQKLAKFFKNDVQPTLKQHANTLFMPMLSADSFQMNSQSGQKTVTKEEETTNRTLKMNKIKDSQAIPSTSQLYQGSELVTKKLVNIYSPLQKEIQHTKVSKKNKQKIKIIKINKKKKQKKKKSQSRPKKSQSKPTHKPKSKNEKKREKFGSSGLITLASINSRSEKSLKNTMLNKQVQSLYLQRNNVFSEHANRFGSMHQKINCLEPSNHKKINNLASIPENIQSVKIQKRRSPNKHKSASQHIYFSKRSVCKRQSQEQTQEKSKNKNSQSKSLSHKSNSVSKTNLVKSTKSKNLNIYTSVHQLYSKR